MIHRLKTFDPWLFLMPVVLMAISVIFIYTLTIDTVGPSLYLRQLLYCVIGLVVMVLITFIDYKNLRSWSPWLYAAGLLLLLAVKLFGKEDFGAQRWIDLGFFQFQPAELEKLIVVIGLAALLYKQQFTLPLWRFAVALLGLLIPVAAVILQPDLGTAIVIVSVGLGMILHARLSKFQKIFLGVGSAAVILAFILSFHGVHPFNELLKEYQKDRLASFVEPSRDQSGSGYNVIQSTIAVGSGGLTGKGLGFGSQSQLNFLPVAHADFIFAGIAEAWGLVGAWGIIALYVLLIGRILQAARIARDEFGMLVCIGIILKILVEVMVNIGMNIRLMPVTGIPLPFLSFGGTTLLTNALCIGIVQSIVMRYKRLTF